MNEAGEKLELRYVPLEQAVLWERNAKKHDFGAIIKSIRRHGFLDPMKFDARLNDGRGGIVEGNGRATALRDMCAQSETLPRGIVQNGKGWLVPILFGVDAESQAAAESYAIDHNNITMLGGDFDMLEIAKMWEGDAYAKLLQDLQAAEMPPVSMDDDDIAAFLRAMDAEKLPEGDDDEHAGELVDKAEELNKVWQVKLGDLWECGEHRIICGDCRDDVVIKRLMQNEIADLIHADPPYGMGKEKDGIANDNLYREKLDRFQMQWWKSCRPYIEDNASAYIWGNAEDLWRLWYVGGLKDSERLTFRSQIIWDKPPSASSYGSPVGSEKMRSYPHGYETSLFFMLGEQGFNNNADNYWEGWEPIRVYLDGERKKLRLSKPDVEKILGSVNKTQHIFSNSHFNLIAETDYKKLQVFANGIAFKREYDELKREHDELKREFYKTRAYFDNTHDNMTDVWEFPRVTGEERHGHATPKPVDMIKRVVLSSCPTDKITLVPFAGTAPELIACQQLQRKCRAVELNPSYVSVALQRWSDLTGKTPQRIEA